ncbi:MAG: NADH-quinone oxidoreductase subunit C [Dehalococcoidales bacterium]|jgi:NADH-quinone oxidoreductase subunit C|nr:NADH-quinone oxidoreductase subunit C [Dehalococcoidales bacterium]
MTVALSGIEVARKLEEHFPGAIVESSEKAIVIRAEQLLPVMNYLKNSPEMAFSFLSDITSTDYFDYFEIIYQLTSLEHNHKLTIKTRCYDRNKPVVPSVTGLWQGANFMEREIFDLMGIAFSGHPTLKRIFLWEGFEGHPLRKDYL